MKRRLASAACALIAVLVALVGGPRWASAGDPPAIEIFVRPGCSRCVDAKAFVDTVARERPGLQVIERDVSSSAEARDRLRMLAEQHGVVAASVPTLQVGDHLIVGFDSPATTGARILAALDGGGQSHVDQALTCPADADMACEEPRDDEAVHVPLLGTISPRDLGLPLFTLAVGLLDGFNPCAMWVLLLLLSFLAGLGSRKKMLAVGGTFVLVSGIVYFAFMAAWLNVFLIIGVSRPIQLVLGLLALGVGAVNVKDFFALHKGISLSIPESAKPGLYRRMRAITHAHSIAAAVGAAAVMATLVNFVELLCTAGFPALYTRILTLRQLPAVEYYGYLGLYNVAYMADDALMLTIAVATLGRRKLQEREGRALKLVSGLVMAALGLVLLFRPGLLA